MKKAEERKELKSNALVAGLQNFWTGLWDGTRSTNVYIVGVIVLLVVGVVVAFWFYASISNDNSSKLWLKLDDVSNLKDLSDPKKDNPIEQFDDVVTRLREIATKNPGTPQARVARFEEARLMFYSGMDRVGLALAGPEPDVVKHLNRAIELYTALAKETNDNPALQQEALLGVAKAHEGFGNVEKAIPFYEQLAAAKPESDHTKQAQEFLDALKDPDKGKKIKDFYAVVKQKLDLYNTPLQ